ncbi:MAG: hypothetical protein R3F60_18035 [bacterium]
MASARPVAAAERPARRVEAVGPRRQRGGWHLWAAGLGALGITPGAGTGGALLGADVEVGWWRLGLEGRWLAASSTEVAGGRVEADALQGAALGCVQAGGLGGCAVGTVGWQRSAGSGFAVDREAGTPFVSVGVRARYELLAGRELGLVFLAEAASPIASTRLRVGDQAVWESAPVGLLVGLGGVVAP